MHFYLCKLNEQIPSSLKAKHILQTVAYILGIATLNEVCTCHKKSKNCHKMLHVLILQYHEVTCQTCSIYITLKHELCQLQCSLILPLRTVRYPLLSLTQPITTSLPIICPDLVEKPIPTHPVVSASTAKETVSASQSMVQKSFIFSSASRMA